MGEERNVEQVLADLEAASQAHDAARIARDQLIMEASGLDASIRQIARAADVSTTQVTRVLGSLGHARETEDAGNEDVAVYSVGQDAYSIYLRWNAVVFQPPRGTGPNTRYLGMYSGSEIL